MNQTLCDCSLYLGQRAVLTCPFESSSAGGKRTALAGCVGSNIARVGDSVGISLVRLGKSRVTEYAMLIGLRSEISV